MTYYIAHKTDAVIGVFNKDPSDNLNNETSVMEVQDAEDLRKKASIAMLTNIYNLLYDKEIKHVSDKLSGANQCFALFETRAQAAPKKLKDLISDNKTLPHGRGDTMGTIRTFVNFMLNQKKPMTKEHLAAELHKFFPENSYARRKCLVDQWLPSHLKKHPFNIEVIKHMDGRKNGYIVTKQ